MLYESEVWRVKSRKLVMIFSLVCFVALALALLFLPDYSQPQTLSGVYIGQSENHIKLYCYGNTYQYVDVSKLDDLPDLYTGDRITVEYRTGGAFTPYERPTSWRNLPNNIVATGLKVHPKLGSIYVKPTNITPTDLQLQLFAPDERLTGLMISTDFCLEKRSRDDWSTVIPFSQKHTEGEWLPIFDGGFTNISWANTHGALQPGTYRIEIVVRYNNQNNYYSAEFIIP